MLEIDEVLGLLVRAVGGESFLKLLDLNAVHDCCLRSCQRSYV